MSASFTVTFEGDHVEVVSEGEKNLEFAERMWAEVVRVCKENDCYHVLGVTYSTVPMSTLDGYEQPRVFQKLDISPRFRIAWVEKNIDAWENVEFMETVFFNRGLPGRAFPDVEEARQWLFGDDDAD